MAQVMHSRIPKSHSSMKTNTLPALSFLAAVAAWILAPLNPAYAAFLATACGILCVFALDYAHPAEPARVRAEVIPFRPGVQALAESDKAA